MTISALIAATNVPLAIVALLVGLLGYWKVYDLWREGECSERMYIILGIGTAWTGSAGGTIWWLIWRVARDYGWLDLADWMDDSWAPIFFKLMVIAGGLLHLRTFTWEWPWPDWMRLPWAAVERAMFAVSRLLRGKCGST